MDLIRSSTSILTRSSRQKTVFSIWYQRTASWFWGGSANRPRQIPRAVRLMWLTMTTGELTDIGPKANTSLPELSDMSRRTARRDLLSGNTATMHGTTRWSRRNIFLNQTSINRYWKRVKHQSTTDKTKWKRPQWLYTTARERLQCLWIAQQGSISTYWYHWWQFWVRSHIVDHDDDVNDWTFVMAVSKDMNERLQWR